MHRSEADWGLPEYATVAGVILSAPLVLAMFFRPQLEELTRTLQSYSPSVAEASEEAVHQNITAVQHESARSIAKARWDAHGLDSLVAQP